MRNQAVAWCLSATVLAGVGCGEGGTGTPTPTPLPLGAPIAAPLNTWTFVDFPDSACDDGSATGVAVNLSGGKDLLVYMMGRRVLGCADLRGAEYLDARAVWEGAV